MIKDEMLRVHLWVLTASESYSKEELAALQWEQVKRIVAFAYNRVPFWKQFIQKSPLGSPMALRTLADFQKIPLTTKQVLKSVPLDDLRAIGARSQYWKLDQTSGSTGEPFQFFLDLRGAERKTALILRGLRWMGASCSRRIIRVRERDLSLITTGLHVRFRDFGQLNHIVQLLEHESLKDKFILHSHASNLLMIAEHVKKKGANVRPGAILTTSEYCSPEQKSLLSDVFRCPVGEWYSSREVDSIASSCSRNSMHINIEQCFLEIVDDGGHPLPETQRGKIVVTFFNNHITPFIRYVLGDMGRLLAKPCPCGLPYPVLEFEGREIYIIKLPDGRMTHLFTIMGLFHRRINLVQQYQIIREGGWDFRIRLVAARNLTELEENLLLADLRKILGAEAQVHIELVKTLFRPGEKQIPYRSLVPELKC